MTVRTNNRCYEHTHIHILEYIIRTLPSNFSLAQSTTQLNSTQLTMNSHNDDGKKGACGWHFMVLMSRQGKVRLSEFFSSFKESEKRRILRDIAGDVLPRAPKMCNIIEKGTYKFVYRRYASLYFVAGVPLEMNELLVLEQIHLFVEALDGYFNSGEFSSVQYMFVCYVVMSES